MQKTAFPAFFLTLSALSAQTDNFNDGNDTGWTRFTPLAPLGGTFITFPAGGYQLACQPSPDPGATGPARLSSLRPEAVYTDFVTCVDFTGWDVTQDTSMGVLARLQPNPGPGDVNGYALTYQGNDRDLEINRVVNEGGFKISTINTNITLDPAKTYRMVFFGLETHLEGRIYDRDNPLIPLATITANDSVYASGSSGILVFSEKNTAIAATFDNYRGSAGTAPFIQQSRTPTGGLNVSWNTEIGLSWRLETADNLLNWSPQEPALLENGNTVLPLSGAALTANPLRFFRFAKGPLPVPL